MNNKVFSEAISPMLIKELLLDDNLKRGELTYLLGSNIQNISKLISIDDHNPIRDITIALTVRLLLTKGDLLDFYKSKKTSTFLNDLSSQLDLAKANTLGPLLGREIGSGYRWLKTDGTSPSVDRLINLIYILLNQNDINLLVNVIEMEASLRGTSLEEIVTSGNWSTQP